MPRTLRSTQLTLASSIQDHLDRYLAAVLSKILISMWKNKRNQLNGTQLLEYYSPKGELPLKL